MKIEGTVVVSTMGRLAFSDTINNLLMSLNRLQCPTAVLKGSPYWEQSITHSIKTALKAYPAAKYLLFFDGDSIWTDQDIEDLYKIIEYGVCNGKPIDAVGPVQADRSGKKPLCYNWLGLGDQTYDYTQPITPVIHSHFGLTFIRRAVFETLPEPWFLGVPANDGTWDLKPGKMDADTYFWVKMWQNKKVVVQANYTVVGHMELGVRWQVGSEVIWQTLGDYYTAGKPYGVRCPAIREYPEKMPTPNSKPTPEEVAAFEQKKQPDYAPPKLE